MGKILIIKDVDFSSVAVDKVTVSDSALIYSFDGTSDGETFVDTGYNLIGDEYTQWTMYVHWSVDDIDNFDTSVNSAFVSQDGKSGIAQGIEQSGISYPGIGIQYRASSSFWFIQYSEIADGKGYSIDEIEPGKSNLLISYNYNTWYKKVGLKRNGENGYISVDGVNWYLTTNKLPYSPVANLYIFNNSSQKFLCAAGVTVSLRLWNDANYDISGFF